MNKKLVNITIIALLLLNAGTLAFLWAKPGKDRIRRGSHGNPVEKILKEDIGFDDQQIIQFKEAKKSHRQSVEDIQKTAHGLRQSLLSIPSSETAVADSVTTLLGQSIAQLEYITWQHFQDLRGICKEDQVAKFDLLLENIAKRVGPRHPKGRSPKH